MSFPVMQLPVAHADTITSGDVIPGDATSGRACAHDNFWHHHTAPPQIITGWCFYTTDVSHHFQQYFSYIMATGFSGGRSRSTRRELPTMGKQLVNFITCS
jgi:hypothetical protein